MSALFLLSAQVGIGPGGSSSTSRVSTTPYGPSIIWDPDQVWVGPTVARYVDFADVAAAILRWQDLVTAAAAAKGVDPDPLAQLVTVYVIMAPETEVAVPAGTYMFRSHVRFTSMTPQGITRSAVDDGGTLVFPAGTALTWEDNVSPVVLWFDAINARSDAGPVITLATDGEISILVTGGELVQNSNSGAGAFGSVTIVGATMNLQVYDGGSARKASGDPLLKGIAGSAITIQSGRGGTIDGRAVAGAATFSALADPGAKIGRQGVDFESGTGPNWLPNNAIGRPALVSPQIVAVDGEISMTQAAYIHQNGNAANWTAGDTISVRWATDVDGVTVDKTLVAVAGAPAAGQFQLGGSLLASMVSLAEVWNADAARRYQATVVESLFGGGPGVVWSVLGLFQTVDYVCGQIWGTFAGNHVVVSLCGADTHNNGYARDVTTALPAAAPGPDVKQFGPSSRQATGAWPGILYPCVFGAGLSVASSSNSYLFMVFDGSDGAIKPWTFWEAEDPSYWAVAPPETTWEAIERLAKAVSNSGASPIPA